MKQPDVDYIEGLTPVISLKQIRPSYNPRSTIGMISDISLYLRYLFSTAGVAHCLYCNKPITIQPLFSIIKDLESLKEPSRIEVCFPYYLNLQQKIEEQLDILKNQGYRWVYVGEKKIDLRDDLDIPTGETMIMVLEGRIYVNNGLSKSDNMLIKKAVKQGNGFIKLNIDSDVCRQMFNRFHGCAEHGFIATDLTPSFFSFNDLDSCCPDCQGSGMHKVAKAELLIINPKRTLLQGPFHQILFNMKQPYWYMLMYSVCVHYGIPFNIPYENLSQSQKDILLYNDGLEQFPLLRPNDYDKKMPSYTPREGEMVTYLGLVKKVDYHYNQSRYRKDRNYDEEYRNFMIEIPCPLCEGTRLKLSRKLVTLEGLDIYKIGELNLSELSVLIEQIQIDKHKMKTALPIVNEIKRRINALVDIGLGYLSLNRRVDSLSSGEFQRVRLANQLGSGLVGLTYVIDEPTVGLHGYNNEKVIDILNRLKKQNNTVITIEHDIDIIKSADYIIEIGPGAGVEGGAIIAQGTINEIAKNERSLIKKCLNNVPIKINRKYLDDKAILIEGASENNLKNIDVRFPLNNLICVTGVSGSGKSSLVIEILAKACLGIFRNNRYIPGKHLHISGMEHIRDIYCIDQSQIHRTETSTPCTFLGVMDTIRKLFSECKEAKESGLDSMANYSFNTVGGCASCKGSGNLETHIHYLGDMNTVCPTCQGKRYTDTVLTVHYKEKTIADVLDMTICDALGFFKDVEYIRSKLSYANNLGLGYMKMGQQINTVSGGEAQRLHLCREIGKNRGSSNMLYIIDEPSIGLHPMDIERFMNQARDLVNKGNTLIIIEHNLDVIIHADYIIDMGPGAGKNGGQVVVSGTLQEILNEKQSLTGQYIRRYFNMP